MQTSAALAGHSVRFTPLGAWSFVCGILTNWRVDVGGELFLGEPLLVVVALALFLIRGTGPHVNLRLAGLCLVAGALMLMGYALSDLVAGTEAWQYTRGWGRVVALVVVSAALIVLASHAPRAIWWFALGLAAGALLKLAIDGVPLTQWKIGYGEALLLLAVVLAGLVPAAAPGVGLIGFGLLSIGLDYRSLALVAMLVGASLLWRRRNDGHRPSRGADLARLAILSAGTLALLAVGMSLNQEQYETRRQESNFGRSLGLRVAAQAVIDSPILGYGSWAADERYVRILKQEAERASATFKRRVDVGDSMLPHSQWLQAWVEGGILAVAFFVLYGYQLLIVLLWLVRGHCRSALTPLYWYSIYFGLWNLLASPMLGIARTHVALALAVIVVLSQERGLLLGRGRRSAAVALAGSSPGVRP